MADMSGSVKTIMYAFVANLGIAIIKSFAAVVTGSGAMLAEAIHSFADCANQLLLFLGIKRAKRPPSPEFPLGYGKEIYFWSFIVAVMLFSVGGLFSIYEGVHKLAHPEPLAKPHIALIVLAISMVLEAGALLGCMSVVRPKLNGRSWWQWFRKSRQSELVVVFGEDSAALLGLTAAFVAVVATMITGNPLYDALGSIAIGAFLIVIAILVGREVKELLVGQGVDRPVQMAMEQTLRDDKRIAELYNVITYQMGNDVMVAVKARMCEEGSVAQLLNDINATEADFKRAYPQVLWLFFEADNSDD
ncbi:cation diffusion facilitator family transporter [Teredinibacter waterburyi]|uniref:cation diffusion facilitator family transporter n=1 Tax=Teredinibacter waterburyi TaxID=1500538 RepID=UPI00165EEE91|nr:cation diffusion facilitator family transporter [Teredinibacter waterburyi]